MSKQKTRDIKIDGIKGLGILSVILLHTLNGEILLKIGAPLHIWQAVPIFIILQGLNLANSYKRREFKTLKDFNDKSYQLRRFQRLIFPFLIFFAIQTTFLWFDKPDYFAEQNHFLRFLTGGRGPGSYFIPLTIQAQLLMPLIYLAGRRSVGKLLTGGFLLGTALEGMSAYYGINEELYRILIIRFVFALILGVALALWEEKRFKKSLFYGLVVLSMIYILGVMYFDWHFIMEHYWHSQHIPGFFYPLAVIIVLRGFPVPEDHFVLKSLSKIGKASYHIFFVQIFYFWEPIRSLRPALPLLLGILVNLTLCTILGILFYHFEQRVWEKIEQ